MPHLLIAGRTGTGKSVCLNAMILSILMTKRPDEVKLLLIDPKMVELSQFKRIPHLMHPVVTDMKKAESLLSWACDKMDERYAFLARAGVRNIQAYNALGPDEIYDRLKPEDDEEARTHPDAHALHRDHRRRDGRPDDDGGQGGRGAHRPPGPEVAGRRHAPDRRHPEADGRRHHRPDQGQPARAIAFQVASRGDSRVVLDEMGADKLLGNGDMLFLIPGTSHIVRAQGTYVSDTEVNRVCEYLEQYPVEFSRELVQLQSAAASAARTGATASRNATSSTRPPSRSSSAKAGARARSSSAPWVSATAGPPG